MSNFVDMEVDEGNGIMDSLAERYDLSSGIEKKQDKHGLPWVEKYRPSSLDELIAHEDIRNILKQLIISKKLPHLLFYGPPGTGTVLTRSCRVYFISLFQEKLLLLLPQRK
jgi:hypothetical protein